MRSFEREYDSKVAMVRLAGLIECTLRVDKSGGSNVAPTIVNTRTGRLIRTQEDL